MRKTIQVAVAIITQPDNSYLLTSRPEGKGWAGWWEFPGGKIEQNEIPEQALSRELEEELGITPTRTQAWLKRRYDYPATKDDVAKTVLLHFYFVRAWQGDPIPQEGQQLAWQRPQQGNVEPILPANAPIMRALALPDVYAISNMSELGEVQFFTALQSRLDQGLSLLQIREPSLDDVLEQLTHKVLSICTPYDCQVLLNGSAEQAQSLGTHGVHLNRYRLMEAKTKPALGVVAASCHDAQELAHANTLKLDCCVVSPILPTASHPEATGMGWDQLTEMIASTEIPVYALGGMNLALLNQALAVGARGIAMQRAYWA